jgi:ABC-type sugar transport system permease subunit
MLDSKPLPIREIKKMIWMNNHNKINFGISISIAVISVIIVIFVTFIIYRAYKVKQDSVQEPNNQV